jgi:adenylate cyclase
MDVFQMATSSPDFYSRACRAAVELVGLDSGRVLVRQGTAWQVVEQAAPNEDDVAPISRYVLDQVVRHSKTFWKSGSSVQDPSNSLGAVHSVVAAPILDRNGDVSGILYGERTLGFSRKTNRLTDITELDALLLELVACAVASGLARLQGEDAARRVRLQFEQFFTPELAQHLETHPDMLNGRDADVSVMFCDIRGFSRISEKIGAARTFDWINDVMGTLSDCVSNHQGVLVDYIGDELMAMWGAPERQADHARRACLSAIDMIELVPRLNERWESVLKEPFDLGIGISSGPVRAGNMGSNRKFKYGPLGNTVNLASRVQGATKYFKSPLIVTGATAAALDEEILMRRLADVRVVNIEKPISLFELPCGNVQNASKLCPAYEEALICFEQRDFRKAAQMLTTLMASFPDDGASVILLSRAVSALVDGPGADHPIWQMHGK